MFYIRYSKPLIEAYWKKKKTSRKDFLKSINPKRKTRSEESPKKNTKKPKKHVNEEESSSTHKYGTSEAVELSVEPETGLQWSDLKKVITVFHSERNGLFSEAKWSDNTTTFIPNFVIRNNQPSAVSLLFICIKKPLYLHTPLFFFLKKLIQYYEALLEFRS
jgi:hypothetical protein